MQQKGDERHVSTKRHNNASGLTSGGLGGSFGSLIGSYSVDVNPMPIANIPINNIPDLASGAVIPPNAPFAAILGDQKHGTNIEAPLSAIEDQVNKAVRNAMGNQQRGGTYVFNAQMDRRTIFHEVIEEAKLRQMATGRNPFELAQIGDQHGKCFMQHLCRVYSS